MNTTPENQSLLSRRRNNLILHATPSELKVKAMLEDLGVPFCFQKGFFTEEKFFIVDFYFARPLRICLEIDGPIHASRQSYDSWRDDYLQRVRRFRVIRKSNEWANNASATELKELLK